MGFIKLLQRFGARKEQEQFTEVENPLPSFHATSKQPTPKMKKPIASFQETFKQAFRRSKGNSCGSPVVADDPHAEGGKPLSKQMHLLNDVGCVKYIDTFVVADIPPTYSTPKLSTGEGALEELSKTSTDSLKNEKPESSTCTSGTESLDTVVDGHHSSMTLGTRGLGSQELLAISTELLPLHKRNKSLDQKLPRTTLQRTRSQTSLYRYIEPHLNNSSSIISRRSSVSHHSLSKIEDGLPSVTGPVQLDLENGMLKLHQRTACIELASSQRSLDQKFSPGLATPSEGSAFENDEVLTTRNESSETVATYISRDDSCPDDDSHRKTAHQVTLRELPGGKTVNHEITVLKAQLDALHSEKDGLQKKYDEDIAFKDEQMQKMVSMCQAFSAENDELKTQAKRPIPSPTVKKPIQQAPNSEVVKLREVVKVQRSELSDAVQHIDYLQCELARSKATEQQQNIQLYNAFTENQNLTVKIAEAVNTNKKSEKEIHKLKQLKLQVTGELIDAQSECERLYFQNRILRFDLEKEPAKVAQFDRTIEHLKSELSDQEERRVQAEELNIQLQKEHDKDQVKSKAEITALTDENKVLTVAVNNLRWSKGALEKGINTYFIKFRGTNAASSLEAAVQSFRSAARHDQAIDTQLITIAEISSKAIQKAKGLEIHCNQLQTSAKEQDIKYMDLEADYLRKSSKVDALEMEAGFTKSDHEKALSKKDDEISKAKKEAAHSENLLNIFQYSQADLCTKWFFKRLQKEAAKAKDTLKHTETRVEALQQNLHAKIEHEKMDKDIRDYNEWQEVVDPGWSPAERNEIEELKQKVEDLENKLLTPDVVPWKEHLLRVEEVKDQTIARLQNESREQLEATVTQEVTLKFGEDFIKPLVELCYHLWVRILRLENNLVKLGADQDGLVDSERHTLLEASKEFAVFA